MLGSSEKQVQESEKAIYLIARRSPKAASDLMLVIP